MLRPFRLSSGRGLFLGVTGFLRGLVQLVFVLGVLGAIFVGGAVALAIAHFSRDLPDHQQLLTYQPATGTKVYAGDGSLMAEFATERRVITPFKDIPPLVVKAFLSAEDRDFYSHNGVNPASVLRAGLADVVRYGRGQRPLGASTITQQLVRHFLLTNEVSISRKIKEALLAYRIENQLSKDRILEIYLNEIYLGAGAYGVAAAADTYFGKPLSQLTLAEMAYLAALPKAPNNYNPLHHAEAAKARRDWVLDGMSEQGWITAADARAAKAQPLGVTVHAPSEPAAAGYFLEEVRRQLLERYGEKAVYEGGLTVRTSYVPVYQAMAEKAFRNGLVEYDRRHGWRGAVVHLGSAAAAQSALRTTPEPTAMPGWRLAAVTGVDGMGANITLKSGASARIPLDEMRWARRTLPDQRLGSGVFRAQEVVVPGDIVLVEPLGAAGPPAAQPAGKRTGPTAAPLLYGLRQVPDVSGGFIAMDPKTGRVFAIVGGWDYHDSQFDRAVQARRQPGSSIKPFVYVTALQGDYTPSSVIEDAPISLPQGPGLPMWSPANYEGNYVGSTTLRQALVHSRNLATARLASQIGMPAIAKTVEQFHIMDKMPLYYSMALGAGDTTLFRLTSAYAMLDNGGHWLNTSMIDMVQDVQGRILYQKATADCAACFIAAGPQLAPDKDPAYTVAGRANASLAWLKGASYAEHPLLYKPVKPDPLVDPTADAEIISMMEGVVQEGTGTVVAAVGKPLAGKTGTTSDWFDAWFVGFSPELAAGAFVGFDTPRTLGDGETGGHVAAPIFRDFMADALKDQPALPFPQNPGAEMVLVNSITGQPTVAGDKDAVLAPYRPGTAPASRSYGGYGGQQVASAPSGYPTQQETADAIDGAAPINPYAATPMSRASLAGPSMMPVNAGMSPGAVVPRSSRLMTGTGGLY
jgi:penicillin-binding protein 1A